MKLHGWCTVCHKIKLVNVKFPLLSGTPTGVCDECEQPPRPKQ